MSSRERNRSPRRYDRRDRDRRRRSVSPSHGSRQRSPRAGRYRDDEYYDRSSVNRYDDDHRRSRRRSPDRGWSGTPMSYKDFIRQLDDHITPTDAEREYQDYLAHHWGSELRREFEAKKDERWMRAKYDPREIKKLQEEHSSKVADLAKEFVADLQDGKIDPDSEDFNQGAGPDAPKPTADEPEGEIELADAKEENTEGDDKEAEPKEKIEGSGAPKEYNAEKWAPPVSWQEDRIQEDLKLSQHLARKLDQETGVVTNPLVPRDAEHGNGEGEGQGEGKEEPTHSYTPPTNPVSHLDLVLTYLWRVHGVDYYAGSEYIPALMPEGNKKPDFRKLRGPAPSGDTEEAAGPSLAEFGETMEKAWKARAEGDGPFEKLLRSKWVEEQVDEWVENQVTKIEENKWGCKLSTKLFVGKAFVYKHIRGKHSHLVDAEREKILDDVYMKNFMEAEEQQAAGNDAAHHSDAHGAGAGQFFGSGPPGPMRRVRGGPPGGRFGPMGPMMGRGGRGHMGPMGGRGGGPRGGYGGGMPMIPPMAGQVLVPAPGAGPLGPFIMAPGPMGPMPGAMIAPMAMMGVGGRGGYQDLDAPRNNRAVLDYGDL